MTGIDDAGGVAAEIAIWTFGDATYMTANVAGAFLGGVAIGCACAYFVGIEEKC